MRTLGAMTISIDQIDAAIEAASKGKSFTDGDTTYTRQDLDQLYTLKRRLLADQSKRGRSVLDRAFLGGVSR